MRFSMPFSGKEEAREEVCRLALCEGANRRQLCRWFGISAKTLYRWLKRYRSEGPAGLTERSRRPHRSPSRTDAETEEAVLAVRRENPVWGGRKIAASLRRRGLSPPCPSTITEILRRNGQPMVAPGQKAWKRFEHAQPNTLWQMDFKGDVPFGGGRLHPLTAVDDHSRYAVVLQAVDNERRQTVQSAVQAAFERYGLPEVILTDNGNPGVTTPSMGSRSLASGSSSTAWRPGTVRRAIRRATARTSASTARLRPSCSMSAPSTISTKLSKHSTPGAIAITIIAHTMPWLWLFPPTAIGPAPAPSS